MSIVRSSGILLIALALGSAVALSAADTGSPATLGDAAAMALARQARDALLNVEGDPNNADARGAGLAAFRLLYAASGWERFTPDTTAMSGEAMRAVIRLAGSGDASCLEALMDAARGPYGRATVEGSEWLNEILWTLLADRTQLTLDVLAQLAPENRRWLVDHVYSQPVHHDFDFAGIGERLSTATVPQGLKPDVRRMLDAAWLASPR